MNQIDTIRAALEQARKLTPKYFLIHAQYELAFAALAELETEFATLRARLTAIEAQPTVATVRADYNDTDAWNFIDCDDMPEAGTQLIARPETK